MRASILIYSPTFEHKALSWFREIMQNSELRYYASDIFNSTGAQDFEEFRTAMNQACVVLQSVGIPLNRHIQTTFRGNSGQVFKDWKLSSLACFLIRINGNPLNRQVALNQIRAYNEQTRHGS